LTTSGNDTLLARACCASMLITHTATRADLRGTLNQGAYLGLGLRCVGRGEGVDGKGGA
jgi:hypothetical protein